MTTLHRSRRLALRFDPRRRNLHRRSLSTPVMRSRPPWLSLLVLWGACAHPAAPSTAPAATAARWIDDPLLGAPPSEVNTLQTLAQGDLHARRVRLDRLLDLFDAARFGRDEDARETLWSGLGGNAVDQGERATRDATERMLQDALALEEAAFAAGEESIARFASDVITMLSTDLQAPGSAEDLSIRTLVYRTLVDEGHPRLVDNARWRIYDHVRGTLAGAVAAPAGQRMEVAVQALYAQHDSVEMLLADIAPHARPAWPSAETLWGMVDVQRQQLAAAPRWAAVLERRDDDDDGLHDTLRTVLPAPRQPDWPLQSFPAGTGRVDSLAPVLRIDADQLFIDAGRPHARAVAIADDPEPLSDALVNGLAADGRGTVLLVAEPMLPAPQLHAVLQAIHGAQIGRVELAVREPRIDRDAGEVVMALPLHLTRASGERAGDLAWQQSRVRAHLDGRGASFAVDGRWLDQQPSDARQQATLVQTLARAYPRERGVLVTLGPDVQLQQLNALWVALGGGPDRPFEAVGWSADGERPPPSKTAGDRQLARRAALAWDSPQVTLDQAYPLEAGDQARLESFARELAACLPELEAKSAPTRVQLALRFSEGRLRETRVVGKARLPKAGVRRLVECVATQGYALRLHGHREGLDVEVALAPAAD